VADWRTIMADRGGQAPAPSSPKPNPWTDSPEAKSWKTLFAGMKGTPYTPTDAELAKVMGEAAEKVANPVPMIGDAAATWSPEQEKASQQKVLAQQGKADFQQFPATGTGALDDYEIVPLSNEEWAKLTSSQQRAVVANQLLYEASQSTDKVAQKQIYDLLGLSDAQRSGEPTTFATMEDIERLGEGYARPLPDNTPERTAVNDKQAAILQALRNLGSRIAPTDSTQSAPSALNLNRDIPASLQSLLGRGLTTAQQVALDNIEANFLQGMVTADREGMTNTPGVLAGFEKDFSAAIKDLPVEEVAKRFKQVAETAKAQDPTIDVDALLQFYGLGGKKNG